MLKVIKKDGTLQNFDCNKIVVAVKKSAERMMIDLSVEDLENIVGYVVDGANDVDDQDVLIPIEKMHHLVEAALEKVNPIVAKSYRDYRNYKTDFVEMLDDVYQKAQSIMYIGDKDNANTDSALVATKRSLIYNALNKELYKKFNMTKDERQAVNDGYIYIHDMSARRDSANCCLFDMKTVLSGGFEMGNVWYNEPNSLDTAFDVMGDIILGTASQQYGGFTVPQVDEILKPYAEKSYKKYYKEYESIVLKTRGFFDPDAADEYATKKVEREFEQGWQGIEYKLNTVGSSRGDYPFITMTIGLGQSKFEKMASIVLLRVHSKGQGKEGNRKPVLFPKIVFLYDKFLHGPGCPSEDVFNAGVDCSMKTMYPKMIGA